MAPINWGARTPAWMYLVLAAIFAINAVIWALVGLRQGGVLPLAPALVWTIGTALWVLVYFRRRRRAAK